jgi:curved DNA-binding protein CbpA
MQEFEEDYYAILGVEETATPEEIRKAYLGLAKKLHPDRYPNDPAQREIAQREFAKVTRAHDIVGDAQRRTEYDALRTLSKVRSSGNNLPAAAAGNGNKAEPVPLSQSGMETPAPANQAVDDENINIKWANKHLERADDLFRKRKFQEAETAMKEAIRLVPLEPRYHNKMAEIYLARGWRTLATTEVQASLRIDPRNSEAKVLDARIKQLTSTQSTSQKVKGKGGILDQIKNLFSNKKR